MKQDSLVSVSIIVPIFRVELYLRECIESLISQTLKDIEIILVDDGSDDGCAQICDQYAERDSRIKVVHKKNGGLDSARKAGIAIASGKYVGYWTLQENQSTLNEITTSLSYKQNEIGGLKNSDYCAYSIRCLKE